MRRFVLLVPFVLACGGGNLSSVDSAAAQALFASTVGDAGVNCLHREPPPFHACVGLDAGAPCAVPGDDADGGQQAFCKALRDGRVVCAEADDDDDDRADGGEHADAGEHRDGGDDEGDGGEHHVGADGGMDGPNGIWMHDGGLPPPFQAAVDACSGHAADDVCTVTFHEHVIQGACRLAPDGKTLICAPLCPHR